MAAGTGQVRAFAAGLAGVGDAIGAAGRQVDAAAAELEQTIGAAVRSSARLAELAATLRDLAGNGPGHGAPAPVPARTGPPRLRVVK